MHLVYDRDGNLLVEADGTTGGTIREYIWLSGRSVAFYDDVTTGPLMRRHVHVDHLGRPVMVTSPSKAIVWRATYTAFGEALTITGSETLDARFPGQWLLTETALHHNWHRWYDPSTGRYTQSDPLGLRAMLADGPSRYGYVGGRKSIESSGPHGPLLRVRKRSDYLQLSGRA